MIVGLVASYREGQLVEQACRSLRPACDVVTLWEGPTGEVPAVGEATSLAWARKEPWLVVREGRWPDEAAKRTAMTKWAADRFDGPTWVVVLDADELLIWGEYLPDMIRLALHDGPDGPHGGFSVRKVEYDGTVAFVGNRVFRADVIDRFLLSNSQVVLHGSPVIVSLPNVPLWLPGDRWEGPHRPPLQGEPHILHRSGLRPPGRADLRLHQVEASWFPAAPS